MSRVIGCAFCECDIEGMHHDLDCPTHPDYESGGPDAAPPKEVPLCQTCGQKWDADMAAERCTYSECPYGEAASPPSDAAPVLQNDVLNYLWSQATLGDKYAEGLANRMEAVPDAHPEDAPGGPWKVNTFYTSDDVWAVQLNGIKVLGFKYQGDASRLESGLRNVLNRLKGNENG